MPKAGLSFTSFEISKVFVERKKNITGGEFEVEVDQSRHLNKKSKSIFRTRYILSITEADKGDKGNLVMKIEAFGYFKITGKPTKEVLDNYYYLSAPSIVYPYLRAFVANLTTQIGMNAITLDTIDVASLPRPKKKTIKRHAVRRGR